jgi:hypothetical protein
MPPQISDALAMLTYLLERGLYGAMAAVLIVPELATFLVFLGFTLGVLLFAGRFAWDLVNEPDKPAFIESSPTAGA